MRIIPRKPWQRLLGLVLVILIAALAGWRWWATRLNAVERQLVGLWEVKSGQSWPRQFMLFTDQRQLYWGNEQGPTLVRSGNRYWAVDGPWSAAAGNLRFRYSTRWGEGSLSHWLSRTVRTLNHRNEINHPIIEIAAGRLIYTSFNQGHQVQTTLVRCDDSGILAAWEENLAAFLRDPATVEGHDLY